jgi:hypothetical protein
LFWKKIIEDESYNPFYLLAFELLCIDAPALALILRLLITGR